VDVRSQCIYHMQFVQLRLAMTAIKGVGAAERCSWRAVGPFSIGVTVAR
jgi:hypothetical protein